jgi:alkylation response protein AidB-like acyl-CoA dehydrogenase
VEHPIYLFPVFGLLALGIAAVALGIGRAAIDELVGLAGAKTPTGSVRKLGERPAVQAAIAQAEATLRSAGAFLYQTVEEVSVMARQSGAMSDERRALLRLAATHATTASARVVDAMYGAGGGTAIYQTSPLQRYFRDVHTATQHMMVAPPTLELAGKVLLGVPADTAAL